MTQETFLNDLVKIIWHLDEPLADLNTISTWNLAQLASKHTDTVFSAMGSDELLAGHSRYLVNKQGSNFLRDLAQPSMSLLRSALVPIFNWIYKPIAYQMVKESRTHSGQFDYLRHNAVFNESALSEASPKLSGNF